MIYLFFFIYLPKILDMSHFIKKNITAPSIIKYPKVEVKIPTVNDEGYYKVGSLTLRKNIDYMPQKGVQENFVNCNCNLIFMCGESQIGKSFGVMLKALQGVGRTGYTGRIISVRLADSKKGSSILRDAIEVMGKFGGCEYSISDYPTFFWEKWNNAVQLTHCNFNADNPQEWDSFKDFAKKHQASFISIDEMTEMKRFKMFAYWFSRNRDNSGMTPCMACTFNPEHDHFTTRMLLDAGYIGEDWYLRKDMIGKVRYFYIAGEDETSIVWGDTREEVASKVDIKISDKEKAKGVTLEHVIKSFTVFTGETADNAILLNATKGQNIGNLHAVGGTQRSVLKGGYFGKVDNEELNITRQMIHNLWINPEDDNEEMYATLDVSGGGENSDDCPMIIWKGLKMIAIKMFKGNPKELEAWIATTLQDYQVPISNFAFDATGIGYYLGAYTNGVAVTGNRRTIQELDEQGNAITMEQYFDLRSQLHGKAKVMFEKGELCCGIDKDFRIPYGKKGETRRILDILFDEMNVFISTTRNKRIYYRSKNEYKAKFKSSPDLMDAIVLRMIFELNAKPKKKAAAVYKIDNYSGLNSSFNPQDKVVWV